MLPLANTWLGRPLIKPGPLLFKLGRQLEQSGFVSNGGDTLNAARQAIVAPVQGHRHGRLPAVIGYPANATSMSFSKNGTPATADKLSQPKPVIPIIFFKSAYIGALLHMICRSYRDRYGFRQADAQTAACVALNANRG